MTNLRTKFTRIDNIVYFEVITQSKVIDAFFDMMDAAGKDFYEAENGLRIGRNWFPEIMDTKNKLFLRGKDTAEDNKRDKTRLGSVYMATEKVKYWTEALVEFSKAADKAWDAKLSRPKYFSRPEYFVAGYGTIDTGYANPLCKANLVRPAKKYVCREIPTTTYACGLAAKMAAYDKPINEEVYYL